MTTQTVDTSSTATSTASTSSVWEIDAAHSSAQFSVKHMMVSTVRGHFNGVSGTITLDEKDVTKSKVDVTIDTTTIDTRDEKRDAHLKSADFFEVEKYPQITFKSTKVTQKGDGHLAVEGDLAMHGVTKSVTLEVEGPTPAFKNPWGATVRGASAEVKINRKDWNLTFNMALAETGGVLVGEDVKIHLDVELTKKA